MLFLLKLKPGSDCAFELEVMSLSCMVFVICFQIVPSFIQTQNCELWCVWLQRERAGSGRCFAHHTIASGAKVQRTKLSPGKIGRCWAAA